MMSDESTHAKQDKMWHFRPDLPLSVSPYFSWPFRPEAIIRWFARSWLPVTERLIFFLLAWVSWLYIVPDVATITAGGVGWIAILYVKNISLMVALAGGLHLYLYRFHLQAKQLKFDRSMANRDASRFTFGNQVKDNIFWSLASGVTIWTAIEASLFWLHAHNVASTISFASHPVWFVALFVIVPWWNSLWFYMIHRALHWPLLYRLIHHVHHRNVSVGPWSGNAMHPLEHVIWMSGAFIYAIIACNPVHILFSQYLSILGAVTSHSGYEGLVIGTKRVMRMGDFFHQLHHRFYECNYGTSEVACDKWAGSFHDGTPAGMKQIKQPPQS